MALGVGFDRKSVDAGVNIEDLSGDTNDNEVVNEETPSVSE